LTDPIYLFYDIKEMARGSDDLLGTLELIVLLSLICLGTDAYGIPIRDEIHLRIGRNISFGAVYVTLQRLAAKGFVESWMGEPTAERGGRAKKFFRVTTAGRQAVERSQRAIEAMSAGIQAARGAM
jgi:DNA-binding PadR family transcriptional regulator